MQLLPRSSLLFVPALFLTAPAHGVARTAAGASRDLVCRESGPGSSDTSPEIRRNRKEEALLFIDDDEEKDKQDQFSTGTLECQAPGLGRPEEP
ncbi:hypothetical protein NDU88_004727 [Pleurodeles waltl]|uniref:Uncharacterized protein n=1 Tax=Pleurodeles waltl TaxID=8319 RepID=A0AAV7UGC6_PLEWA|nr:hypothetical protein NDU88_004727 [Pleurodeles waltl]